MLVIHPDECIDCGVCEPECPAGAILPDSAPEAAAWLKLNAQMARHWPTIRTKGEVPADADEWKDVTGKYPQHFSSEPAGAATRANTVDESVP
jgi:ferredoxin